MFPMCSELPSELSQCYLCTALDCLSFLQCLFSGCSGVVLTCLMRLKAGPGLGVILWFLLDTTVPLTFTLRPNSLFSLFKALGQLERAPLPLCFPLRGHTQKYLFGPQDLALLDFIPKGIHTSGTHKLSRAW